MENLVALGGGSFDPVGKNHRDWAQAAAQLFRKVKIIPCGPRPDKVTVRRINPVHRAAMLQLGLGDIPGVEFDFSDLEKNNFTTTWELERRFTVQGTEVVHLIGSDLLYGPGGVRNWSNGQQLWGNSRFVIFKREGYPINPEDLPPKSDIHDMPMKGSSTEIRSLIYHGNDPNTLVPPAVAEYIQIHALYTGMPERPIVPYSKTNPAIFAVTDAYKPKGIEAAKSIATVSRPEDADIIGVFGGDGTLLKAIKDYWYLRKPFFGYNYGTLGFLLCDVSDRLHDPGLFTNLELANCPMLHVTATLSSGEVREALAFGDAWVEADRADSIEFDILVNGKKEISATGFIGLMCTPAGSTGYYLNISKTAFQIGTPMFGLTAGLGDPIWWHGSQISDDTEVEFVNRNPSRRPMFGFADGKQAHNFGPVLSMKVRKSRIAGVRLLKTEQDFRRKFARKIFPS